MKLNFFGVILIVIGVGVLVANITGGYWIEIALKLWPIVFILRSINNWERDDQTKAFQVGQAALGCVLIADNFVYLPQLSNVWSYWPVLLIAWGLHVIFGNGRHGGTCEAHRVCSETRASAGFVLPDKVEHFRLIRELWPSTVRGEAKISMNAGTLNIGGATDQFFEGEIDSSLGDPEIEYEAGSLTKFAIKQPSGVGKLLGNVENRWNLKFTRNIPLEFNLEANACKADIDLREYLMESVRVEGNAGKFDLQIGNRVPVVNVNVEANAGKLEIEIPQNAGLFAQGECALGSINLEQFGAVKEGKSWRTPDFDNAAVRVKLTFDVTAGALEVRRSKS